MCAQQFGSLGAFDSEVSKNPVGGRHTPCFTILFMSFGGWAQTTLLVVFGAFRVQRLSQLLFRFRVHAAEKSHSSSLSLLGLRVSLLLLLISCRWGLGGWGGLHIMNHM